MTSEIQKERVREYFITSAKEILSSEGLGAATARNIAAKAGFSYATIYQYFKDTRNLLFICAQEFLKESENFILQNSNTKLKGEEKLINLSELYLKYFIQYPGIYELLFVENSSEFTGANPIGSAINDSYNNIFDGILKEFVQYEKVKIAHKAILIGTAHLYLIRREPIEYSQALENLKNSLNLIIDSK